ncbi:hypothetical protein ABT299_43180 [Spirillospora sp. NPDC000708]
MPTCLVIRPDGTTQWENLPTDTHERLAAMYQAIGGGCRTVEPIQLAGEFDMWFDEDGLYTQVANPLATAIASAFGFIWQPFHGAALVTAPDCGDGPPDLTHQQRAVLMTMVACAG